MHLLPVFYTSNNTRKRKAKKPSKSAQAHEEWLKAQGLHISQLKQIKKKSKTANSYAEDLKVDRSDYVSAGISGTKYACAKTDIMTNLHKEPRHVQEAILAKAARTAPLYSKGPYQLITDGASLSEIGKKM
jgi:hypothetical protein